MLMQDVSVLATAHEFAARTTDSTTTSITKTLRKKLSGPTSYSAMPMEQFPPVLGHFKDFSRSFYIVFSVLTMLIDALVISLIVARRFPRFGQRFNEVTVFSLATCDLVYEAATTSWLLRQASVCEENIENSCKTPILTGVYLALNLCTVFHIVVEIVGKIMHSNFASLNVMWSVCAWISAFGLAYFDLKNENGLMAENSMILLGRFKAFGHVLFGMIFFAWVFVIFLSFCSKTRSNESKASQEQILSSMETTLKESAHPSGRNSRFLAPDDLLISCIILAFFVGWHAWVVIGVDSRAMVVIEVMKSFEVIRLGVRIMNPLTIISLSHKDERFEVYNS